MSKQFSAGIGILLMLVIWGNVWGQGYSIRGDRVIVDRAEEWRNWSFSTDIADISEEGWVRPRRIQRGVEAMEKLFEFGGGIRDVGSNPEDAPHILDGDPETFWEPDREDPLENWWVEIDLGRLVSATELTLRFSENGDPFLLFEVLVSDGRLAFEGSRLIGYRVLDRTTRLNTDQREFLYELEPGTKATEGWTGAAIQYIRIEATGSRGDRAEEVTEEAYADLSEEEQGTIEYLVEALPGEFVEVSQEQYEGVPEGERGPVRYYRRELPRLAHMSVRSVGDNIALGILDRGGSLDYAGIGSATSAFDGSFTEQWESAAYRPYLQNDGTLIVDLGAGFWIDAVRIVHSSESRGQLPAYVLRGSDGAKASDGSLLWTTLAEREQIPSGTGRFEDTFPLQKARFLLFRNLDPRNSFFINEIQIYGQGYVPEVVLTSDLIELGGARSLTTIEWEGRTPEGTRTEIRTRTGDELNELKRFYDKQGNEITEQRWNGLPGFSKGEVVIEQVPGPDWSGWSIPYIASGDEVVSPSPRKYAMLEARLISEDPDRFSELDRVVLSFISPIVRSVLGEISPEREVMPGRPTEFALFLQPTLLPSNPGFDRIQVTAPPGVMMELVGVGTGTEDAFLEGTEETFAPDERGRFSSPSGDSLRVLGYGTDSMEIVLPKVVKIGNVDLIRVEFRSVVYLNGTVFQASLGNTASPEAWQRIDSGDATYLTSSRGMTVSVSLGEKIIEDIEIGPNPFTPNGDGINDETRIAYSLLKLTDHAPLEVGIYDIGGRRVRELHTGTQTSGRYTQIWDGLDDQGTRVPPGLYIYRISVHADDAWERRGGVLCVSY